MALENTDRRVGMIDGRISIAVEGHGSINARIESTDSPKERGLAASGGSDDGQELARYAVETDIFEHDLAGLALPKNSTEALYAYAEATRARSFSIDAMKSASPSMIKRPAKGANIQRP